MIKVFSMIAALVFGTFGVVSALLIGTSVLALSASMVLKTLVANSVAGFFALVFITRFQHVPWFKKWCTPNVFFTWCWFLSIYIGLTWALSPKEMQLKDLSYLALPLMFSTGFIIILYGPLQDYLTRKQARKKTVNG